MTEPNPYEQLGIAEDASFDEIQAARDRLVNEHRGDIKIAEAVEAAYDAVLMDRLRLRQEGKLQVPDRIRFPDRTDSEALESEPPKAPQWLSGHLHSPAQGELLWTTGIFGILGTASFISGAKVDSLAFILGLGFLADLYFLNRKGQKFGRALLLTCGGLVVGLVVGALLATILLNANVLGPGAFALVHTLVALFTLWIVSSYLY